MSFILMFLSVSYGYQRIANGLEKRIDTPQKQSDAQSVTSTPHRGDNLNMTRQTHLYHITLLLNMSGRMDVEPELTKFG